MGLEAYHLVSDSGTCRDAYTRCSAEVRGRRFESLPLREIESGILPIETQQCQALRGANNTWDECALRVEIM